MPVGVPFGNYELIERIAEGGMAEVWRARSRGVAGFEKTVVVKRVLPELAERSGFPEMLVREAKIAARLSHPNIVQIFDLGEVNGSFFIAMEYVRGCDLGEALNYRASRVHPFSLPLRLWIVAEVAKALDYARRAVDEAGRALSVVHSDISPQNILLGFEGEVKVSDFGVARADVVGLGRGDDPGVLRGKYAYMSPEQARGELTDPRTDIFSLGVVLYELIARKRYFGSSDSKQLLERIQRGELPNHRSHVSDSALVSVLTRALSPDRDSRYPTAGALGDALTEILRELDKPIGSAHLAQAMREMFPESRESVPNKLRTDLLLRAVHDASSGGSARTVAQFAHERTEQTRALPGARRSTKRQKCVWLGLAHRPRDAQLMRPIIEGLGGYFFDDVEGYLFAVFGLWGSEGAISLAARGALELRRVFAFDGPERVARVPVMAMVTMDAVVGEDGRLWKPKRMDVFRDILSGLNHGEIGAPRDFEPRLHRDFICETWDTHLCVRAYRSRRDRDARSMRMRSPLFGRRKALSQLSGWFADAAGGLSSVVRLVGASGMGKSRLLAEIRSLAAPQNFTFLHGRIDESMEHRPYAAFAEVFADLCGIEASDEPQVRFEKVERLRVLGLNDRERRRLGEVMGLSYATPMKVRVGRPRGIEVASALRTALRALARDRVVVLALEDLQWMDDATRQVLPLVVENMGDERVLVLLSLRAGSTGPLPKEDHSLVLNGLDLDSTRAVAAFWLGRGLGEGEARHLLERTGGNPAWIEALVSDGGSIEQPVSDDLAERVGRLELCIPRVRDASLLRSAALFDGPVSVAKLAATEGLVGGTERGPMRRLLNRRVLVPLSGSFLDATGVGPWGGYVGNAVMPTHVRFPATVLKDVLVGGMSALEARRRHRRILRALEPEVTDPQFDNWENLLRHAVAAEDPRAVGWLTKAADAAVRDGNEVLAVVRRAESARLYQKHHEAGASDVVTRALDAASEAIRVGQVHVAESVLDWLMTESVVFSPVEQACCALVRARLARVVRDPRRTQEALKGWTEADGGEAGYLRGSALVLYGEAWLALGEVQEAMTCFQRILNTKTDSETEGLASAWLATAYAYLGDVDRANTWLGKALGLAARTGSVELRIRCLVTTGCVMEAQADFAEAGQRYMEAAEVAEEHRWMAEVVSLRTLAAAVLAFCGRMDRALEQAYRAERLGRHFAPFVPPRLAGAVVALAESEGDPAADAASHIDEAVTELSAQLGRPETVWALLLRALDAAMRQETDGVASSVQAAVDCARAYGRLALADCLRETWGSESA